MVYTWNWTPTEWAAIERCARQERSQRAASRELPAGTTSRQRALNEANGAAWYVRLMAGKATKALPPVGTRGVVGLG